MKFEEASIAQAKENAKRRAAKPKPHVQSGVEIDTTRTARPAVEDNGDLHNGRSVRVPFGGFQYKLEVRNKDPNYYYYWFKDEGDMIKRALRAGYEFVSEREATGGEELTNQDVDGGNQSLTDRFERTGGKDEFGRHFNLVLMRQPMEYHNEDKKSEDRLTDEIDQAINRQAFQGGSIANKYGEVNMTRVKE